MESGRVSVHIPRFACISWSGGIGWWGARAGEKEGGRERKREGHGVSPDAISYGLDGLILSHHTLLEGLLHI